MIERRVRAIVEYDGAAYAGFQRQAAQPSIQGAIERSVHLATGSDIRIVGAGRTDAGAHALGQVIAFSLDTRLDDATLLRAVNAHLPHDIGLRSLETVGDDFHPRFNAQSREYNYLVLNRPTRSPLWRGRAYHVRHPLELDSMRRAALQLVGCHDFIGFTASEAGEVGSAGRPRSTIRVMYASSVDRCGELIRFCFRGTAFMKHMIRTIVGSLLVVGAGRMAEDEIGLILRTGERERAGPCVPAHGLYLVRVHYTTESL